MDRGRALVSTLTLSRNLHTMNISTHLARMQRHIYEAATKDKPSLVADFQDILQQASRLLHTSAFAFWQAQLTHVEADQLPITQIGVEQVKHFWQRRGLNLRSL